MAIERLILFITEIGSRGVRRNLEEIGRSAERASRPIFQLRRALRTIGGLAAAVELFRMADSVSVLRNRLRVVTTTTEQTNAVFGRLFDISQRTRTSLEGNIELFQRLALSTKEAGISQSELLVITENLNKAIIVSGARSQEATNALIQLSQGLASNRLSGDELRSVLEQLPIVADVIAKQLETTRGGLRDLGKQGKITTKDITDAFGSLSKFTEAVAEAFEKTTPTLGQALTVLRNSVIFLLKEMDDGTGIIGIFANAIIFLAKNLKLLAEAAFIAGTALLFNFGANLVIGTVGTFARMVGLTKALYGVNTASAVLGVTLGRIGKLFRGLFSILGSSPLARIVKLIGGAVASFILWGDEIQVVKDQSATLADVFSVLFDRAQSAITPLLDALQVQLAGALDTVGVSLEGVDLSFANVLKNAIDTTDQLLAIVSGIGSGISEAFSGLAPTVDSNLQQITNTVISALEDWVNQFAVVAINAKELLVGAFRIGLNAVVDLFEAFILDLRAFPNKFLELGEVSINKFRKVILEGLSKLVGEINSSFVARLLPFDLTDPLAGADLGKLEVGKDFSFRENLNRVAKDLGSNISSALGEINLTKELSERIIIDRVTETQLVTTGKTFSQKFAEGFQRGVSEAGTPLRTFFDDVVSEANKRRETIIKEETERQRRIQELLDKISGGEGTKPGEDEGSAKRAAKLRDIVNGLIDEGVALRLTSREREIYTELLRIEDQLGAPLIGQKRQLVEQLLRENQQLEDQADILDDTVGAQQKLQAELAALIALYQSGNIPIDTFNRKLLDNQLAAINLAENLGKISSSGAELERLKLDEVRIKGLFENEKISSAEFKKSLMEIRLEMLQVKIETGDGTVADGFLLQLGRMTEGARTFAATAGGLMADFVDDFSSGFSRAIVGAIQGTQSFGAAMRDVATNALASLLEGLIQLGVQMIINQALSAALSTAAVAQNTAAATASAAAWAPAAAAASLGSFGANAGPASASMASVFATAISLFAGRFASGGQVRGPGGPRSDSLFAAVSDQEFIMNAASSKKFLPLLQMMNRGFAPVDSVMRSPQMPQGFGGRPMHVEVHAPVQVNGVQDVAGFQRSSGQIARGLGRAIQRQVDQNA